MVSIEVTRVRIPRFIQCEVCRPGTVAWACRCVGISDCVAAADTSISYYTSPLFPVGSTSAGQSFGFTHMALLQLVAHCMGQRNLGQ